MAKLVLVLLILFLLDMLLALALAYLSSNSKDWRQSFNHENKKQANIPTAAKVQKAVAK